MKDARQEMIKSSSGRYKGFLDNELKVGHSANPHSWPFTLLSIPPSVEKMLTCRDTTARIIGMNRFVAKIPYPWSYDCTLHTSLL